MAEQDNIQSARIRAEQEPEKTTRERFLETFNELRAEAERVRGTGNYVLSPTEPLTLRAAEYYNLYCGKVAELLAASGITAATVEGALQDYAAILSGVFDVNLPLEEQDTIINTVKQWRALVTERYALNLLLSIYLYNGRASRDYIKRFKNADGYAVTVERGKGYERVTNREFIGVEAQKQQWLALTVRLLSGGTAPQLAEAYYWISRHGVTVPADFAGFPPETVNGYFSTVEAFTAVDYYANYYFIAKYALRATPEELAAILPPPLFPDAASATEYAERVSSLWWNNIERRTADVGKLMEAETAEQLKQAKQDVIQDTTKQDIVRIPETIALLGSRDVYASADGTERMANGILPIQAVITDYMKRHNLTEQVTPRTTEKVIEGVNLLQRFHNVKPVNGMYRFETNISEFSELCGFTDANQAQKMEIWRALQVLDGLYLAVWRPDGLHGVRVFTIQEIGLTGEAKGKLVLQVNADVMKGRPNLISYSDFNALRKAAKGQAENHFRYQIIAKGNKEENALLNEVFGYDTLLREIQASGGTQEDLARARKNISGHKNRDRNRLIKWFNDYVARGWLVEFSREKNGKGAIIYKWKRGNIPQQDGEQAPDEQ